MINKHSEIPALTTKHTIRGAIAVVTLFFDSVLIYLSLFFPLAMMALQTRMSSDIR